MNKYMKRKEFDLFRQLKGLIICVNTWMGVTRKKDVLSYRKSKLPSKGRKNLVPASNCTVFTISITRNVLKCLFRLIFEIWKTLTLPLTLFLFLLSASVSPSPGKYIWSFIILIVHHDAEHIYPFRLLPLLLANVCLNSAVHLSKSSIWTA